MRKEERREGEEVREREREGKERERREKGRTQLIYALKIKQTSQTKN